MGASLYEGHMRGFVKQPGVLVTGAGDAQANGWYCRRDAAEGPPKGWKPPWDSIHFASHWAHWNRNRYWYENAEGCFLYQLMAFHWWDICAQDGRSLYSYKIEGIARDVPIGPPPVKGWVEESETHRSDAPNLRVVP